MIRKTPRLDFFCFIQPLLPPSPPPDENTTWFDNCTQSHDVYMITDFDGDLLIRELRYAYLVRIYGLCRADIGFDQRKAQELKNLYA